jgi:hypothetical protein
MTQPNTVCPSCLRASYHPKDIEHRFCAACSVYYKGHALKIEEMALDEDCAKDFAPDPPCDCNRVHYHINGSCVEIHGEPDGSVHVLCYDGTHENDTTLIGVKDWWTARQLALQWVTPLVTGPER